MAYERGLDKVQTTININREIYHSAKVAAKEDMRTFSNFVEIVLLKYLREQKAMK